MWSYCDTTKDPTIKAPISGELVCSSIQTGEMHVAAPVKNKMSAALSFVFLPNCRSVKFTNQ